MMTGFLPQRPEPEGPNGDKRSQSHAGNPTITKLPDEILLCIFDFYRQTFKLYCCPERVWNSNRGWFKLAHVCRNWRCIVLSSSTRLRLRIYFTALAPTRAAILTRPPLASLPIVVDYFHLNRTPGPPQRLASAMSYPNRVCGIVVDLRGAISFDRVFKALDSYFPALESLEIYNKRSYAREFDLPLPPTFLTTSTKSLRRLELHYVALASLPPLLSAATALVDFSLRVDKIIYQQSGLSLLVLLQYLPRLRHLDLSIADTIVSPIRAIPGDMNDMVSLAQLSYLRVQGDLIPVEQLVARLATPSLQELHISVYPCRGLCDFSRTHLFRFIRDAGIRFRAARVVLSPHRHLLSLCTHTNVIDDPTYSVIVLPFMAIIDGALSDMLVAVEDVSLDLSHLFFDTQLFRVDLGPCRALFEQLQNVKILRIQHGLETEVVNIFRQGYGQPTTDLLVPEEANLQATVPSDMPIDLGQFNLDFLPSLEGIEVYTVYPSTPIPESERASALEPFKALTAACQQAGRPVKVWWKTDRVHPSSQIQMRTVGTDKIPFKAVCSHTYG